MAHTGGDVYKRQARYGQRRLQKDEFVKCLMELKYLAEGTSYGIVLLWPVETVMCCTVVCKVSCHTRSSVQKYFIRFANLSLTTKTLWLECVIFAKIKD